MKILKLATIFITLAALATAQDRAREAVAVPDLLTTLQTERSLAMFVTAVQSSGMAKMLREEGPLTVFALSNRAFANLSKEDREALLNDHGAMNFLLARYIARGTIPTDDLATLQSARTLVGVKFHVDIRGEGSYVNGAKLSAVEIRCSNGVIHVLDSFDPGLLHDALAISRKK